MWRIVLGIFLAAHGLIHLGFIVPAPADPKYPFRLSDSWLVTSVGFSEPAVRLVGVMLAVVTIIGFVVAGLAAVGVVIPATWGAASTVAAGIASILLLIVFWNSWLVLGVVIDLGLLVGLLGLAWQPFAASGA